ncbi:MAG: hypothetical protein E7231_08350 [Cellulosilyticum sp.]|nr:hypothetical protein [Cellulosilyticum sp.]
MEQIENKRIEWIDIFKALVIISMVIGHSTGKYNIYIYQFHMAAFFFISGYTSSLDKKSLTQTVFKKFYQLIVPLVFIFIFFDIMKLILLHYTGYGFGYEQQGAWVTFKEFFKARTYIDVLGATWFLGVLYGIFIFQKSVLILVRNKVGTTYFIICILASLIGYEMAKSGHIPEYNIDLILIGQLYFAFGLIGSKIRINIGKIIRIGITVLGLLVSVVIMLKAGNMPNITVDYPSRLFGNWIINVILAMNGIWFIYCMAYLLEYIKVLKKNLLIIGQNTLGILFLHFLMFKPIFLLESIIGERPSGYIKQLIPDNDKYWVVIAIFSIVSSILIWNTLLKNKVLSILLGKNSEFYEGIVYQIQDKVESGEKNICMRMEEKIEKLYSQISLYVQQNKMICCVYIVFSLIIISNIFKLGITVNDDLQFRLQASSGFDVLFQNLKEFAKVQSRWHSFVGILMNNYIYFFCRNQWVYRGIGCLIIIAISVLLGIFIKRVQKDDRVSKLCSIVFLAFLPITFEHALPNAFVGYIGIAIVILLASFICFDRYCEEKTNKWLIISSILYLYCLLTYEVFIIYVLVFIGLYILKNDVQYTKEEIIKIIMNIWPIIMVVGIYLAIYVIGKLLYKSTYGGNTISIKSFGSSIRVLYELGKVAIPGYYLFNKTYLWLFGHYTGMNVYRFLDKENREILFEWIFDIKIILLLLCVYILSRSIFSMQKKEKTLNKTKFIGVAIVYIILPFVPLAITEMYQEIAETKSMFGLPVTFLGYIAAIVALANMIILVVDYNKKIIPIMGGTILIVTLGIQSMNSVFSERWSIVNENLKFVETYMDTEFARSLEGSKIVAPELYIAQDSLGFNEGYWTTYNTLNQRNIQYLEKYESDVEYVLRYNQIDSPYLMVAPIVEKKDENNIFVKSIIIYTEDMVKNKKIISENKDGQTIITDLKSSNMDNGLYRYVVMFEDLQKAGSLILADGFKEYEMQYSNEVPLAHNKKIEMKNVIAGNYYLDGWISRSVTFTIRTGTEGVFNFEGYLPEEVSPNTIRVYANKQLVYESKIKNGVVKFECDTKIEGEKDIEMTIELDQAYIPKEININEDERELAINIRKAEFIE